MNIMTRDLKEMILGALDDAGGREYLHKQATVNPTAFMSLVGKVLPTTLVGDPKRPIHVSVTEEERRREVDAAIDAAFGVLTSVSTEPLAIEHEPQNVYTQLRDTIEAEHELAETVSANIQSQAVDNADLDDKVVQLSHTKPHP